MVNVRYRFDDNKKVVVQHGEISRRATLFMMTTFFDCCRQLNVSLYYLFGSRITQRWVGALGCTRR